MLNIFKRNSLLLEENIIEWIIEAFLWNFKEFGNDVFINETILVVPDNNHFPGKETSADGMANLIFEQVKHYAGMTHWPTQLFNSQQGTPPIPSSQAVVIKGGIRGKNAGSSDESFSLQQINNQAAFFTTSYPQAASNIPFSYHPQQLKSPEGIIAHFAHGLSHHLAATAKTPPPGGADYRPMTGEITGIFMGFGVMFANSAIVARAGGCGGCGGGQSPVRQVYLNEEEATYALAVFCNLKSIEGKQATKHLKKHLRGFFKSALKDSKQRLQDNELLMFTQQNQKNQISSKLSNSYPIHNS